MTCHVFAAPRGFASVVIPATQLYILGFTKIRSGVLETGSRFPITSDGQITNSNHNAKSQIVLEKDLNLYAKSQIKYQITSSNHESFFPK